MFRQTFESDFAGDDHILCNIKVSGNRLEAITTAPTCGISRAEMRDLSFSANRAIATVFANRMEERDELPCVLPIQKFAKTFLFGTPAIDPVIGFRMTLSHGLLFDLASEKVPDALSR